jgi:hypothetical protein
MSTPTQVALKWIVQHVWAPPAPSTTYRPFLRARNFDHKVTFFYLS